MSNKKYKPMACVQCEAILIAAQKVIDDWNATRDMGVVLNDKGEITWVSLYELESLLKNK